MAFYGIPDSTVTYGASDISAHITKTHPEVEMAVETEEHTALGQSLATEMFTGLTSYGEITVSGPYSEAIDGILGAAARARTTAALVIKWGGTKTTTFSLTGIKNYKRTVAKGEVTSYEATFFLHHGCTATEA